MNALIIEDESLIAEELKATLADVAPDIEVLHILPRLKAARKWFMSNPEPDLLFMDIRLSDGLSFELFGQFQLHCPVIFCTAYEEYAIRAFKVNGVDYLLKPVQEEDLRRAVDKVRQVQQRAGIPSDLEKLVQYFTNPASAKGQYKERFIVSANNKWMPVETSEIAVFYKDHLNYLYTFNGEKLIYDFSALEDIEELLDPQQFFRANRQTIINIRSVQLVRPHGNQKLLVQLKPPLKLEVDISREKAPAFRKWVDR
jgi:DNA-binding LytR/AlgR family response regulator